MSKEIRVGFGLGALEVATCFAGLLVVIGLLMESGPEAWTAFITKHWPHRDVMGNALVTMGVFAEVAIGLFIARDAKRAQLRAEAQIAEVTERASKAEERAAVAEQAAAEANLARVKIEQRMKPRVLTTEGYRALVSLLAPFSSKSVDVIVFDHHIPETLLFADQLMTLFISAGWLVIREWESRKVVYRISGPSVVIAVAVGHEDEFKELAHALARALMDIGVDCGVRLGSFGCKGPNPRGQIAPYELDREEFALRFQKPLVVMGTCAAAPFRVQIGEKQLSAPPPAIEVVPSPKA
jgi:hypothetical protein